MSDEDADTETSGNHVNDALNQCDASGRVLVNIGHPANEPDIFLAPQIAAAVKPHQVHCSFLADRTNGRAIGTVFRLSLCLWRYVLWLNGES